MKISTYGERDYVFGQLMLTLRTHVGITQAGLARKLHVSRQSVGEWEAGSSYPKTDHLKHFIALGVQQRAFTSGHEAEEIRTLWQAAHQKLLIDEAWLQRLLSQISHQFTLVSDVSVEQTVVESRVDWGDALDVASFYGREWELAQLSHWVLEENCRVISVLGLGGIGKSALTVSLMHQVAPHFEVVIWRSLRDAPSCAMFLATCLQVLAPQSLQTGSAAGHLDLLMEYLREHRVLLVIDNLERLLQQGESIGSMLPDYADYGSLLRRVAETAHQSCLILTSREKPSELLLLEGNHIPVRTLNLTGLDADACEQLLAEQDIVGTPDEQTQLIEAYTGNPLALKIVAQSIVELFGGDIAHFLDQDALIFGSIRELLREQFVRLSAIEQTILLWLAIVREPISIEELLYVLGTPLPQVQVLEAVNGLRRRSLIERGQRPGSFTLQSVILEYATAQLITEVTREIQLGQPGRLIEHGLELATAKEYVRQTQERLIVLPILDALRSTYPLRDAVEKQLLALLNHQRERSDYAQGYGSANLLALLRQLHGHLRNLDLSHLSIRAAYLQGIEMQDTLLSGSLLRETTFTEAFDSPWVVAISPDGSYRATGNKRGEVRLWREGGKILDQVWQAHTAVVQALAFSPDGCTLATGSCDQTIKLWDLKNASLLWMGCHTGSIRNLAFAPNGHMLASGGDAAIELWNTSGGMHLHTLSNPDSPVYALSWNQTGNLLASGSADGGIRLWEIQAIQAAQTATSMRLLTGHTDLVWSLAFSPDGQTLASGSFDRTVKLWDLVSGDVRQTLTGHTGSVSGVVWSPAGNLLASCSRDQTIRLWDVAQNRYHLTLHGHTAAVHAIAFTPDSRSLLSGSEDGTLRVWYVENGQCLHLIQGYAVTLYDLAWNPDGTQLASAGSDSLVTIWDTVGGALPRLLHGHHWIVNSVAWSPDGRLLASCEVDNTIRVWNMVTETCVQILRDPDRVDTSFFSVAWSPDGHWLASGSYPQAVQVWDVTTGTRRWVNYGQTTKINHVQWSPDGTRLASCSDDGSVTLWKGSDGTQLAQLQGHHAMAMNVAWSPDGARLLTGGGGRGSGELFIWDTQSGQCLHSWNALNEIIYTLAWSPSGSILITGDNDGRLRWWDIQSKECIRTHKAHQGTIQSLKISPDGRLLASCGDDNIIQIWNLENGELLLSQRRDRPYERLDITNVMGLTPVQKTSLYALGAIEHPEED